MLKQIIVDVRMSREFIERDPLQPGRHFVFFEVEGQSTPSERIISFLQARFGAENIDHWTLISDEDANDACEQDDTIQLVTVPLREVEEEIAKVSKVPVAEVFALQATDPEVLAYGMAKYSRSALPLKTAIKEISSQKASDFLNTFYFQYGHKSIADLAHVPMAFENVSLLAAIEIVDEQRWDGQERSTRYQDFSKRQYYTPEDLDVVETAHYHQSIKQMFDGYDALFAKTLELYKDQHPRPEGMDTAAYERTLRARAFDVARYLLPMATLTSVGQITSARTLEGQISRMLASPFAEVQDLAGQMKRAASQPAFNTTKGNYPAPAPAPTLVKYTAPSEFQMAVKKFATQVLGDLVAAGFLPANYKNQLLQTYLPEPEHYDSEIIATILYEHSHLPFGILYQAVKSRPASWRREFMASVLSFRGPHDELPRTFRAGTGIIFDIHMDIGGMRDMHRHRRCVHVMQSYTGGDFAFPEIDLGLYAGSLTQDYENARRNFETMQYLRRVKERPLGPEAYLLPLGTKTRFLMKMDIAEAAYIAELRTGPAGHISYRRVAWAIFGRLQGISPLLAEGINDRVTNPANPLDFFKR